MSVPSIRISRPGARRGDPPRQPSGVAPKPPRPGDYVLYWMIAARRPHENFALDRALEHSRALGLPLVVFEALRIGYPWASDRLHQFVLGGMQENLAAFEQAGVTYFPYVEPAHGHGKGLLRALSERAAIVVTDEFPCFFLPDMVFAASQELLAPLEIVDSCGLLPLRASERAFDRAYDFRRYLQRVLPAHLLEFPQQKPFKGQELTRAELPEAILKRWPAATPRELQGGAVTGHAAGLARLDIDHTVAPVSFSGGWGSARATLRRFVNQRLDHYADKRSDAVQDNSSGLSPYLHFGHISAHEIFRAVVGSDLRPRELMTKQGRGQKEGYWGLPASTESFLDELVTWRELGYNNSLFRKDYDKYSSLPEWAKQTLAEHAGDKRPHLYDLATLEAGETHDELWNAAQWQLRRDGRIHNYLRMLWGKKILEWSESPEAALAVLIELNNKYALDGRNPNSYSGIFWCLGRFDRPWGPERPIFGKIRYMTSDSTRRKMKVEHYLERWLPARGRRLFD